MSEIHGVVTSSSSGWNNSYWQNLMLQPGGRGSFWYGDLTAGCDLKISGDEVVFGRQDDHALVAAEILVYLEPARGAVITQPARGAADEYLLAKRRTIQEDGLP